MTTDKFDSPERFQTALKLGQPDMVPIWENNIVEKCIIEIAQLLSDEEITVEVRNFGYDRGEQILELYAFIAEKLDFDATSSHFSSGLKEIKPGIVQDKYGVVYQLCEHGEPVVMDGPIKEMGDLKGFEMASKLDIDEDCKTARYLMERFGKTKSHVFDILDPFKECWYLRGGLDNLLMDYYINPDLVHGMSEIITDHSKTLIDMGIKLGVDTIAMIGDVAGTEAPVMSPAHFEEFVLPYEKEIVDYAHERGLTVIKHSDGNLWPLMDLIIDAGFDGLHPIQPQCMDIAEVKEKYSDKICLLGNIDCEELLCTSTAEEVRESVRETIKVAAPGGGFVICSSNSIHSDVKPENYIAMIEEARRCRSYESLHTL